MTNPCKKHPTAERNTQGRCRECRRVQRILYREKYPEKVRLQKQTWRAKRTVVANYFGKVCDKHPELKGERRPQGTCLSCARESMNKYQRPIREKKKAERALKKAQYLEQNNEAILLKKAESRRRARRKHRMKSLDKHAANQASRRVAKLQATPEWANKFFINEAYHLAKIRTIATGFPWQVDHLVPLKSKVVCGLHCEFNIAVIPGVENLAKGNRTWVDMP